ncbi:hypothetical protein MAR_005350 [Mya arenaria]|uniref:Uncharacterized protein n=1 Tax=Mya arenaria TaxID=6604 RepID=A0ABY7EZ99_MYAAR|nr:hypothetical protein MAR_005350 [Mya arenaria]
MDTDITRNVIDFHPSEADICKANAPLEDAVGDCDVPSTSGFVPAKDTDRETHNGKNKNNT